MPRTRVGNRMTIGIGLNDGVEQDARIIEFVKTSGKSPASVLRDALLFLMTASQDGEPEPAAAEAGLEVTSALGNIQAQIAWLAQEMAAVRQHLQSHPFDIEGNAIDAVKELADIEEAAIQLSPRLIAAVKAVAKPGLRLEDTG